MLGTSIRTLSTNEDFHRLAEEFGSDIPLRRILFMLQMAGCHSCVVDDACSCCEYAKEYKALYSKTHRPHPDKAVRLHFFSSEMKKATKAQVKAHKKDYLGYCTLRPTQRKTVSEAVLSKELVAGSSDSGSMVYFLLCQQPYEVELMGETLSVEGFPFVQKDYRIGMCAQAALRAVSLDMKRWMPEAAPMTMPEITEQASRLQTGSGRAVPSSGLEVSQMNLVLEEMGYPPVVYNFMDVPEEQFPLEHPDEIAYRYSESGFPVILAIRTRDAGHALVVVGHTFEPNMWWSLAQEPYYGPSKERRPFQTSTRWVDDFIIQDDNMGPYLLMPKEIAQTRLIAAIIVPLPPTIHMKAEEAERYAWTLASDQGIGKIGRAHV